MKKKPQLTNMHIKLPVEEKAAFENKARDAGFDLTTWVRLGLRKLAGIDKR